MSASSKETPVRSCTNRASSPPAPGVAGVDNQRIDNFGQFFYYPIKLACAHPYATAVQGCVRTAVDDGTAMLGEKNPIAVAPDSRIRVKVGSHRP
jgi:hypothetical protein